MENGYTRFRRRKSIITICASLLLILLIIYIVANGNKKTTVDPAFSKYIESYTTGVISKESPIRIRLASQVQVTHQQNEQLSEDLFDLSPTVKGKAYWVDARTIEFRPAAKLEPGKNYTADFDLGKLINVPDKFEHFKFDFQVVEPNLNLTFNGLTTATNTSLTEMKLEGAIQTADAEDPAYIEKLLTVSYEFPVKITWEHNSSAKTYHFKIAGLKRQTGKATPLVINWDGSSLNVDKKGSQRYDISSRR